MDSSSSEDNHPEEQVAAKEVEGSREKNPDVEKKKCTGEGLMLFQKQNNYLTKKKQIERKQRKKMVDRLRYLQKKEKIDLLSRAECKEKKYLLSVI